MIQTYILACNRTGTKRIVRAKDIKEACKLADNRAGLPASVYVIVDKGTIKDKEFDGFHVYTGNQVYLAAVARI